MSQSRRMAPVLSRVRAAFPCAIARMMMLSTLCVPSGYVLGSHLWRRWDSRFDRPPIEAEGSRRTIWLSFYGSEGWGFEPSWAYLKDV